MSDQESNRYRDQPKRWSVLDQGQVSLWNAGPYGRKNCWTWTSSNQRQNDSRTRSDRDQNFIEISDRPCRDQDWKARIGPDSPVRTKDKIEITDRTRRKLILNLVPDKYDKMPDWAEQEIWIDRSLDQGIPVPNKDPKHVLTQKNKQWINYVARWEPRPISNCVFQCIIPIIPLLRLCGKCVCVVFF